MKENSDETSVNGYIPDTASTKPDLQMIKYSAWFDLRVFYVRISNVQVDDSTPESLTLRHVPLNADTLLEVNGRKCSNVVTALLRRDRVNKKSKEATFLSTESIRTTGDVKFEVIDKQKVVLTGVLKMPSNESFSMEPKGSMKWWSINCESPIAASTGFLKEKHVFGLDIEVYVAGCFSGRPIILTKTLSLSGQSDKMAFPGYDLQVLGYRSYAPCSEDDYGKLSWGRREYMDEEDGELSWFNAGVRVGVGIGLGMCVGIGIGLGLLVHTYQSTARAFKKRLV